MPRGSRALLSFLGRKARCPRKGHWRRQSNHGLSPAALHATSLILCGPSLGLLQVSTFIVSAFDCKGNTLKCLKDFCTQNLALTAVHVPLFVRRRSTHPSISFFSPQCPVREARQVEPAPHDAPPDRRWVVFRIFTWHYPDGITSSCVEG